MALDTTSFPAYLRSLNLRAPVTTRPRRLISGPPIALMELGLRLGLGRWFFNSKRNRDLVQGLGLEMETLLAVAERLRSRSMWLPVWLELALPYVRMAERAAAGGDPSTALRSIHTALMMLAIGLTGDGLYFYAPISMRWKLYPLRRHLLALHRELTGARSEPLIITHPRGRTRGLLHWPRPEARTSERVPALIALHPMGSDKETFDHCLSHFREAGYATLCVDLPAHGENFYGPRLTADAEWVAVAALEAAAQRDEIDPERLGVIGGSLGGYYALRTAAISPRAKVCMAFGAPFDLGVLGPAMVPGVVETFAWLTGARDERELRAHGARFNLRACAGMIQMPVCLVHGTQDSVCDFTVTYNIVSHLKAPVTVIPLVGADHESVYPQMPHVALPAVDWLREHL